MSPEVGQASETTLSAALGELGGLLGRRLLTDPSVTSAYAHDHCAIAQSGLPAAVVLASSVEEVRSTLRIATRHGIPVVPRGAGSGLSGGANAVDDGVVLVTAGMARILEVDAADLIAVVQPGVITADLKAAARAAGVEYTPDPASEAFSTIGGNIATNAGGLCCVKYGVTRESVLGLEVVRADGTLVRLGARTLKSSAGLDLVSLFVGSEGTLGVVTQATLRLRPVRPPAQTLLTFFATLHDAGAAISRIRSAVVPSLMELMDQTTVRAVEAWRPQGLETDAAALLIVQSDAGGNAAERELDVVATACRASGASEVLMATDPMETELLLTARRLAFPALERLGMAVLDDVGVPCSRIGDLIDAIQRIAERTGLVIGTFGHAGDGNMHPTIVVTPGDTGCLEVAREAFDDIVAAALRLGGTLTGEHGIGNLKQRHFTEHADAAARRLHLDVKAALDPLGILNPGKGF